jgi:hypothetical protein
MCAPRRVTAIVVGLGVLMGLMTGRATADTIIVNQVSDFPVSGRVGLWGSQNDTHSPGGLGNFATTYDNFVAPVTSTLTSAQWTGGYFNAAIPGTTPIPGNITAFTLTFYGDAGGKPDTTHPPLAIESILGNAKEQFVGMELGTGLPMASIFSYSTPLPTPFTLQAGTPYWLSIVADLDFSDNTNGLQWGWHTASNGLNDGLNVFQGPSPLDSPAGNLAFTLQGNLAAVPEPSSLVLFALGALCLAGGRSWRKRAAAR